jgi:hypothetical protein
MKFYVVRAIHNTFFQLNDIIRGFPKYTAINTPVCRCLDCNEGSLHGIELIVTSLPMHEATHKREGWTERSWTQLCDSVRRLLTLRSVPKIKWVGMFFSALFSISGKCVLTSDIMTCVHWLLSRQHNPYTIPVLVLAGYHWKFLDYCLLHKFCFCVYNLVSYIWIPYSDWSKI